MSKVSMLVSQFNYVMVFDLFARPQALFSSLQSHKAIIGHNRMLLVYEWPVC